MEADKEQLISEIRKLQAGDGQAFERLYQMTSQSAYFTALKIVKNEDDAQDVLQESYMVVLDKINDLENPAAFRSWFHMIVANKAKELLRKNNKYLFADSDETAQGGADAFFDSLEDPSTAYLPAAGVEQAELKKQMMTLVDALSDEKRTVILLYYYSELTIRQIAESLDVNENTVKSRLHYAKKELAEGVKEYEKKHGRLRAIAPAALLLLALRDASAATSAAFIKSGAAASAFSAVTAGASAAETGAAAAAGGAAATGSTAATGSAAAVTGGAATAAGSAAAAGGSAAAKIIGMTVAQKVIAGTVVAAVIGGGAAGVNQAAQKLRSQPPAETTVAVQAALRADETGTLPSERALAALTLRSDDAVPQTTEPVTTAPQTTRTGVRAAASTAAASAAATQTGSTAAAAGTTTGRATTSARATTTKKATTTAAPVTTAAPEPATTKADTTRATTTKAATTTTTKPTTTKPTTTKPTTTKPTTTEKQTATVTITITQSGSYADTTTVTLDDGDTFTFSDAKSAVAAQGYDTTYAEYSGGSLPITAEGGRSYSITIDVE